MDVETVVAEPLSPVSVRVSARDLQVIQDKPNNHGGDNQGMMASELLLAGLVGCQHSTFVKVAAKRRLDAQVVAVRGEMEFEDGDISALRIHFELVSTSPAEAIATAIRLTDKTCTISRVLKIAVQSDYTLVATPA